MTRPTFPWTGVVFPVGCSPTLYPATYVLPKGLIPVYDKPLIYYPLSVLMLAGVRRMALIATPSDTLWYQRLLGDGGDLGLELLYIECMSEMGPAESLLAAEHFVGTDNVALISDDCVLFADRLQSTLSRITRDVRRATMFRAVAPRFERTPTGPPGRDGAEDRDSGRDMPVASRDLAPVAFFPNDVFRVAKSKRLPHASRIDLVKVYHDYENRGLLDVQQCGRGFVWLDTLTHEHISAAARFIEAIETSQGFKIACLEEIAWRKGYISAERLAAITQGVSGEYGSYLRRLLS